MTLVDIAVHLEKAADALPDAPLVICSKTGKLLSGTPERVDGEPLEPVHETEPKPKR